MALTKINTDALSDNAVTLAKMASGTDGQIITYDASGNPTAIAVGTDGQVLTSTGAGSPPAFEAAAAGGKVLQVVQNTHSTSTSVGGSAYTNTGLDATITPTSSSSKVLILVHQPMTHLVDTNLDRLNKTNLVRGSTQILESKTLTLHEGGTARAYDSTYMGITYLDSPSTTSATTYKTQFYIDGTSSDLYAQWGGGTSTMILLEIAG